MTYSIYEVFPNHENPAIIRVASLEGIVGPIVHVWSLSFDRLIFLEGSTLKIWDYKADTWGHWRVSQNFEQVFSLAALFLHPDQQFGHVL